MNRSGLYQPFLPSSERLGDRKEQSMTSIKRSTTLSLACGALLALALGSVALATHARPGGGSPFRVPLVVAYNQCGGVATAEDPAPSALTNTHVTPLDNDSCVPQAQKKSGANPPTVTMTAGGICTAPMAAARTWAPCGST